MLASLLPFRILRTGALLKALASLLAQPLGLVSSLAHLHRMRQCYMTKPPASICDCQWSLPVMKVQSSKMQYLNTPGRRPCQQGCPGGSLQGHQAWAHLAGCRESHCSLAGRQTGHLHDITEPEDRNEKHVHAAAD